MAKPIAIIIIAALLLLEGLYPLSCLINPQPGLTNPRPSDIYPAVQMGIIAVFGLAHLLSAAGIFLQKKRGLSLT